MSCCLHPGLSTARIIDGRGYCVRCLKGMAEAAEHLDPHVTPADCFVWYKNSAEGWQPIAGTGCAHYVAHQLNVRVGGPGDRCLKGFTYRVPIVTTGMTQVSGGPAAIQVNDVWVQTDRKHTGLVSKIEPAPPPPPGFKGTPPPIIWITHASSGQHKLATDRFDQRFHSQGDFYR